MTTRNITRSASAETSEVHPTSPSHSFVPPSLQPTPPTPFRFLCGAEQFVCARTLCFRRLGVHIHYSLWKVHVRWKVHLSFSSGSFFLLCLPTRVSVSISFNFRGFISFIFCTTVCIRGDDFASICKVRRERCVVSLVALPPSHSVSFPSQHFHLYPSKTDETIGAPFGCANIS